MNLSPQLQEEISLVWKKPLPDSTNSPEFAELVRFLRQRDPALLARLYTELFGESGVEEVEAQIQARTRAREVVEAVGGEKDERGRAVPSRTKGLLWGLALGFLLLIPAGWYILAPVLFSGPPPRPEEGTAPSEPAPQQEKVSVQQQEKVSVQPPVELPLPPAEPSQQTGPSPSSGVVPPPLPEPSPEVPPPYQEPQVSSSSPPAPTGQAASAPLPEGGGGFLSRGAEGSYERLTEVPLGGGQAAVSPSGAGGSLVSQSQGGGAVFASFSGGGQASFAQTSLEEVPSSASGTGSNLVREVDAERSLPEATPRLREVLATGGRFVAKTPSSDLRPGAMIKARLEAVPVLGGGLTEAPVLAKDVQGRLWLGVASLAGNTGRVQLSFDRVYLEEGFLALKATALDQDGAYGVRAEVQDLAPSMAADILRAGVSGLASYLEDLRNAKQVIIRDNGLEVVKSAPSLEYQVLGNVASLFRLPSEGQSVVRVYRLPRGREIEILVLSMEEVAGDATGR